MITATAFTTTTTTTIIISFLFNWPIFLEITPGKAKYHKPFPLIFLIRRFECYITYTITKQMHS